MTSYFPIFLVRRPRPLRTMITAYRPAGAAAAALRVVEDAQECGAEGLDSPAPEPLDLAEGGGVAGRRLRQAIDQPLGKDHRGVELVRLGPLIPPGAERV